MPKITQPGTYSISMEEYHGQPCAGPSVSGSDLRAVILESPAHFWNRWSFNPKRTPQPDKESWVLGRAAHHLFLGEDGFSLRYVQRPLKIAGKPWHGSLNAAKAWLGEQAKRGRTVLSPLQVKKIRGMAHSLTAHPLVQLGILNGQVEQSLIWRHKKTGLYLKNRPDVVPNDGGDFADLKTAANFGEELDRDVFRYGYDMAAALTKWAAREVLGIEMTSFSFVFVSTEEPYPCEVVQLQPDDIASAEIDLGVALDTVAACLASGNWFGPGGSQQDARWALKPEWVKRSREYRRTILMREIENPLSAPAVGQS